MPQCCHGVVAIRVGDCPVPGGGCAWLNAQLTSPGPRWAREQLYQGLTCFPLPDQEVEAEDGDLAGQGSFKLEGSWLKLRQFHGLIVKRFHCAKRNTKALFSQILLPAFFVCVAMTVALSVPEIGACEPPTCTLGAAGGRFCWLRCGRWGHWLQGGQGQGLWVLGQSACAWQCCGCERVLVLVPAGDLPPLILSPSQYHNYTQPKGNFIPYANEERREYR